MKTYKTIVLDANDIIAKKFEGNIILRTRLEDDYEYSIEFANNDNNVVIDSNSMIPKNYILSTESKNKIKFICNGDYKFDIVCKETKLLEYIKQFDENWTSLPEIEGEYITLESLLLAIVQRPAEEYKFILHLDVDCTVTGAESEAAAIRKILERIDEGNLPAFIPLTRYKYMLVLEVNEGEG